MKMLSLGALFMSSYWGTEIDIVHVDEPTCLSELDQYAGNAIAYAMNMSGDQAAWVRTARDRCKSLGIPTVWHTIEDPNSFETFAYQAEGFDLICTSDAACIPRYQAIYPSAKVIWLPLAAQPSLHYPMPAVDNPADTILIANWYTGKERLEQVRYLVDPIVEAGFSMKLYAFPGFRWPERFDRHYVGGTNHCDVRLFYPQGRIALGVNNQARNTQMCSMRIFEVLACGRPMVAAYSDAYEALGFRNGEHFIWVNTAFQAVDMVRSLLADPAGAAAMAERGRQFVLEHHTYRNRLATILEAFQ